jgi:hypothetical protein
LKQKSEDKTYLKRVILKKMKKKKFAVNSEIKENSGIPFFPL